jgi:hypothetical protein
MKKTKIYFSLLVAVLATLASCTVTKRHYAPGYHVEWKNFSTKANTVNLASKESSNFSNSKCDNENSISNLTLAQLDLSSDASNNDVVLAPSNEVIKKNEFFGAPFNSSRSFKKNLKKEIKNQSSQEPTSVKAISQRGPDALSWFIWIAAILCIPVFGGPLFILIWTSSKNGDVDWKPVLTSLLLYFLCWIPGLIYDIIWINKNCSGSLFND